MFISDICYRHRVLWKWVYLGDLIARNVTLNECNHAFYIQENNFTLLLYLGANCTFGRDKF
jgi:hypothetical protein